MENQVTDLIQYLQDKGVDYADVRYVRTETEAICTEDRMVQELESEVDAGIGIRVLIDGAPGFAAVSDLDRLKATALKAIKIARATARLQKNRVSFTEREAVQDSYLTPYEIDPFEITVNEKIELLKTAEEKMLSEAELFKTSGSLTFTKITKIYADTEGSVIHQELLESGGGIQATTLAEDDMLVRSYPCGFGGNYATAGYEFIEELDLVDNAGETAREAAQLAEAEECPTGQYDLVIDSDQMTLQIHESVGHPIELDRIFGSEAAYAGTSFLEPEMLDEFQYGSSRVNIAADATTPRGLGTFGYDDEGVPAQRIDIIRNGILTGFLTSRDTAGQIGRTSGGAARADGWQNIPLIRMTNINLEPGDLSREELLAGIDDGLYLKTNRSWSIDDKRLNFQFGCEIAYEIKNGRLTGKIYKNPVYAGITPKFWKRCDGIGSEKHWQLFGVPNCGKGQPGQSAHVGHGSAPTRFRQVKVGVKDVN